jgi:tripartite-type tricarboxylate transporter receptor subunit TctC
METLMACKPLTRRTFAALALVACVGTHAQPAQTLRIVVPLAPGGGGDIVARLVASKLQVVLDQPVIVENKPGGATVIGSDLVAKAPADGQTLLMATSSHVVNPSLLKLPYDPVKDFAGVSLIATSPLMLVMNSKTPVKSLAELLQHAKGQDKPMTYASSGIGGLPHLSGELLGRLANLKLTHVPYKGSAPAERDLIGGQVDMFFASPSSAAPHLQSGKLRALAVTSTTRSATFPELPAMAEQVPGFESGTFYALLAPAGTPPAALERLSGAVRKATEMPDVRQKMADIGAGIVASSPGETMKFIEDQIRQWDGVVKGANIKAE